MNGEDLLKVYPPGVYNPKLGKHVLVLWWSHNDGCHVIVSTNQNDALSTWGHVLAKHNAELRSYWEVDLVRCPPDVAEDWALNRYTLELSQFKWWLVALAGYAKSSLPEGFKECKHRENSSARWDCKKCEGRGVEVTLDVKALFDVPEVRALYHKPTDRNFRSPQPLLFDLGTEPLSDPTQPLQVAVLNGGHHSVGVQFQSYLDWRGTGKDYLIYTRHTALFFFQGAEKPMPQVFIDLYKKDKQDQDDRNTERKRKDEQRRLDNAAAEAQLLASVLAYNVGGSRR